MIISAWAINQLKQITKSEKFESFNYDCNFKFVKNHKNLSKEEKKDKNKKILNRGKCGHKFYKNNQTCWLALKQIKSYKGGIESHVEFR